MKERNKRILENYLKYGEQYTSATSYNSRPQKICNYSRLRTTRPTARPSKADLHYHQKRQLDSLDAPLVALCGAYIVNGLIRYDGIWNRYFAPLSAINLGIGGDKTEKRVMANR